VKSNTDGLEMIESKGYLDNLYQAKERAELEAGGGFLFGS
jgi:hypothetical protein